MTRDVCSWVEKMILYTYNIIFRVREKCITQMKQVRSLSVRIIEHISTLNTRDTKLNVCKSVYMTRCIVLQRTESIR